MSEGLVDRVLKIESEADRIIAEAEEEAKRIRADAAKEMEALRKKTEDEIASERARIESDFKTAGEEQAKKQKEEFKQKRAHVIERGRSQLASAVEMLVSRIVKP